MTAAEVPFDLMEVKLAAPAARPGTVAKADVILRLCAAKVPLAIVVETTTPSYSCETSPQRFTK
jgi:hypothetical protein